jgi:hypothetical protein
MGGSGGATGGSAVTGSAGTGGGTGGSAVTGSAGTGGGTGGSAVTGTAGTGGGAAGTGGGVGGASGGTGGGTAGSGGGTGGTGGSPSVTVNVTKAGTGMGTVTSAPAGINCGVDCTEAFGSGTAVTLTATPDASSTFTGWSGGGCTGTGTCMLTATATTTVTATFAIKTWTLTTTLAGTGTGTVTSTPAGIACGTSCMASYNHGTMVTLTASPTASTSLFTGWSGACTGSGTCVVTMDQARSVTATFTQQSYGLTVTKAGTGAALGTVTSTPAGISCGTDCSEAYPANTMVTLTAQAPTGATFAGWSGGGCTGTGMCTVTISAVVSITATFTLAQVPVTVGKSGTGSGTVTSVPAGISCGATCSASFDYGSVVTLSAAPATGSAFGGWSGGGCTGTAPCMVTVSAAAQVTATFTLLQYPLTITKSGTGTGQVTSSPAGISCGASCGANYDYGTMVTLTPTADPTTSDFGGWSGDCTGTGACVVTIDAARNVTASFTLKTRTLTVARTGDGGGTISVNPGAAVCAGATCPYNFAHGTSVSLTATPANGSIFEGWSGGPCSGTGVCTFSITANTSVTATFSKAMRSLTITFAGAAGGSVLVNPGATTVNASGSLSMATHTAVTLAATPAANMGFAGWGGACSGYGGCSFTLDADTTVTVQFDPPNKVFVTSTTVIPGTLGGLSGADTICAQRATAAGLSGTFRAFLGTSAANGNAWSRLTGARGWARTGDGKPVGDQVSDLMAGHTYYPPVNTESGTEIPSGTLAVTGVNGGTSTCGDWTSTDASLTATFGEPHTGWLSFVQNGGTSCTSTTMRLYCFETTRAVMLRPPVPATARYAFLSSGSIQGNSGFTAADTLCQNEATTAGRGGTWRALLAGNGATAGSRLSATGASWYRTDNVQLSATPNDLLGGVSQLWAAMSLRADGVTQEQALVFTGAATVATAGSAAGSCSGWTSTASTSAGMTYGNRMGTDWFGPFTSGLCSDLHRVFCFQQ